MQTNILKVAGKSSVPSVAGSIIKSLESGKDVELHAIGASSVNQTAKAIATARGILASKSRDMYCAIGFSETIIDNEERTLMVFKIVIR